MTAALDVFVAAALGGGEILILVLLAIAALFIVVRLVLRFARPRSRPCPRCGQSVPNGVLDCGRCGFNFRSIGQPTADRS